MHFFDLIDLLYFFYNFENVSSPEMLWMLDIFTKMQIFVIPFSQLMVLSDSLNYLYFPCWFKFIVHFLDLINRLFFTIVRMFPVHKCFKFLTLFTKMQIFVIPFWRINGAYIFNYLSLSCYFQLSKAFFLKYISTFIALNRSFKIN